MLANNDLYVIVLMMSRHVMLVRDVEGEGDPDPTYANIRSCLRLMFGAAATAGVGWGCVGPRCGLWAYG
jgi:hypothetical protein